MLVSYGKSLIKTNFDERGSNWKEMSVDTRTMTDTEHLRYYKTLEHFLLSHPCHPEDTGAAFLYICMCHQFSEALVMNQS